jgi:hypothetical protein
MNIKVDVCVDERTGKFQSFSSGVYTNDLCKPDEANHAGKNF